MGLNDLPKSVGGGEIMLTILLLAPLDFQIFLRPCQGGTTDAENLLEVWIVRGSVGFQYSVSHSALENVISFLEFKPQVCKIRV